MANSEYEPEKQHSNIWKWENKNKFGKKKKKIEFEGKNWFLRALFQKKPETSSEPDTF